MVGSRANSPIPAASSAYDKEKMGEKYRIIGGTVLKFVPYSLQPF
jgi:hypothetical protein